MNSGFTASHNILSVTQNDILNRPFQNRFYVCGQQFLVLEKQMLENPGGPERPVSSVETEETTGDKVRMGVEIENEIRADQRL